MIRLRFVQEYRDSRIVTNGKLYGIEGELVTDCRYLNVAGACAAIDSELGIEARRTDLERHREQLAQYIDREGRDATFGCNCGWCGSHDELKRTGKPDLFRCPACASNSIFMTFGDAPDGSVPPPTKKKVAKKKSTSEKNKKKTTASSTRTAAPRLPALDGDGLRFRWALERDGDDNYYVVKCGRTRLWRERASSGDPLRFYEMRRLLKRKYRARFVDLTATVAAAKYMLGRRERSRLAPA